MGNAAGLDPRHHEGFAHFHRQDYFEAHEVWEDLWNECEPGDRRFYQALIQAAVSLYHAHRGNATGAKRLYLSGKRYMQPYQPSHYAVVIDEFWAEVERELRMHISLDEPSV